MGRFEPEIASQQHPASSSNKGFQTSHQRKVNVQDQTRSDELWATDSKYLQVLTGWILPFRCVNLRWKLTELLS